MLNSNTNFTKKQVLKMAREPIGLLDQVHWIAGKYYETEIPSLTRIFLHVVLTMDVSIDGQRTLFHFFYI